MEGRAIDFFLNRIYHLKIILSFKLNDIGYKEQLYN